MTPRTLRVPLVLFLRFLALLLKGAQAIVACVLKGKWAWEELNLRPHAYQADLRQGLGRKVGGALIDAFSRALSRTPSLLGWICGARRTLHVPTRKQLGRENIRFSDAGFGAFWGASDRNPGDVVLDPFAGLFTVPLCALKKGRRGFGIELNAAYFGDGVRYLRAAEERLAVPSLFELAEAGAA